MSHSVRLGKPEADAVSHQAHERQPRGWTRWLSTDVSGFALFVAGALWSYLSFILSGGDPAPVASLFLAAGAVFGLARMAALASPSLVPALILGTACALVVSSPDALSRHPLSGPFGYPNASGAFFVQAAIAGVMLAAVTRRALTRAAAAGAAIAFAFVPFAIDSRTPAVLVLVLPLLVVAIHAVRGPRAAVLACAVLFVVALTATSALAAWYPTEHRSGTVHRVIEGTLTERRVSLWREALEITMRHPVSGVGPGRFSDVSPAARFNRDTTRWAHHAFLQQGAEAGVPGFTILMGLFLWAFAMLRKMATTSPAAVVGAMALAALGINACLDYVLHFAAIPITMAALVGAATVSRRMERREA